MAKTVKITTDNHISVVEVPWNVEAQGEIGIIRGRGGVVGEEYVRRFK